MIEVRQLRFCRGPQVVLDDLSFDVAKREVVSVIGPSGCGKTTLLKCLAGLERPDAGEILVRLDGDQQSVDLASLSEADLNQVRRYVGLVFQYAALFDSLSVRDNIAFPILRFHARPSERELNARCAHWLEMVGLDPALTLRKMPAELSGGMRKRVGLARALALEPEILLYDEPSSGLDPVSAAHIDRLILEMRERVGVTSIVVSHHVANVLRTSDRVAMLLSGRLIAMGTPAEIGQSDDPRVRQFIDGTAHGPLTDVEG